MSQVWRISEASSIAFHATTMLAALPDRMFTTKQIASTLGVSDHHLSKVLQRLAKAGLVKATRGPKGGFELERPADEITLLEVYEAIEGPLEDVGCLLGKPVCRPGACILGDLLESVNKQVRDYLENARLSELTGAYEGIEDKL